MCRALGILADCSDGLDEKVEVERNRLNLDGVEANDKHFLIPLRTERR
jgi:hypothetical protein